ncbi:MAG: hypothetical protein ACREI9_07725 [Nitrospiraceae bacterium]
MQNFTQWDIATYPGLIAAVVAIIGLLKKLFPEWIEKKEPVLGLGLSYTLGISAKLFLPGAFKDVHWVVYMISLLAVAAGAKIGHDYFVNQIIANKAAPDEKK